MRSISSCERAAPALRGHDERRVLDEAAGVDEIGDVLARGSLPGGAPAGDGVGAAVVEPDVVPLDHLGEIGAHVVEIDRGVDRDGLAAVAPSPASTSTSGSPGITVSPTAIGERRDDAGPLGRDDVLHLHRLEHHELLADAHGVALGHVDRHDRSLHRRHDGLHAPSV